VRLIGLEASGSVPESLIWRGSCCLTC